MSAVRFCGYFGSTLNGLDPRYGAGQPNIQHSYTLRLGGEMNSVEDGGTGANENGYDYDPDDAGPLLGTNPALFVPDADPTTTTSPTNADTDGDGHSDGAEDLNRNGRVDLGEADPNNPNSIALLTKQVPTLPGAAVIVLAFALSMCGILTCFPA